MQISVFTICCLEQVCADNRLCYLLSGTSCADQRLCYSLSGTSLCRSAILLFAVWNYLLQISIFVIRRLEPALYVIRRLETAFADKHLCYMPSGKNVQISVSVIRRPKQVQISIFVVLPLEPALAYQRLCYSSSGASLCVSVSLLFLFFLWNHLVQISVFVIRRLEQACVDKYLCCPPFGTSLCRSAPLLFGVWRQGITKTPVIAIFICIQPIVFVEWASRVNFVTILGDLYQNKLWVICNNLNQFAHLSSASGPSNDVIKMATIVLLMSTYKTSYLKQ